MPVENNSTMGRAASRTTDRLFIHGDTLAASGETCTVGARPCRRPAVALPSNKSALLVKSLDFECTCCRSARWPTRLKTASEPRRALNLTGGDLFYF